MKRLGIFVFYDEDGIVDEYVYKLLDEVVSFCEYFVIVCNGIIEEVYKKHLANYATEIIVRNNKGYDAGAYKDTILYLHEKEVLHKYDELLLINDTFFGPFYSLNDFFNRTILEKEIDFWGMTKHPEGDLYDGMYRFDWHIQSYFLLIKYRMFHSKEFLQFWKNLDDADDLAQTVMKFEVGFSTFFRGLGYRGECYCDLVNIGIPIRYNENPYMRNPYELIKSLQMPFLKIKSIYIESDNCLNALKAIDYLEEMKLYNVEYIWQHIRRISAKHSYFDRYKLDAFCKKYSKLYIYGAGQLGHRIKQYLNYKGYQEEGFVVSRKQDCEADMVTIDQVRIDSTSGIIVAMNRKHTAEVIDVILTNFSEEHIFTGNYLK